MKLVDMFNVTTTRPLNALNVVGIAELAQFTDVGYNTRLPCMEAEQDIRKEWSWEVDKEHEMNELSFNWARIVFKDGSMLKFEVK